MSTTATRTATTTTTMGICQTEARLLPRRQRRRDVAVGSKKWACAQARAASTTQLPVQLGETRHQQQQQQDNQCGIPTNHNNNRTHYKLQPRNTQ